jgi:hypothetical protein
MSACAETCLFLEIAAEVWRVVGSKETEPENAHYMHGIVRTCAEYMDKGMIGLFIVFCNQHDGECRSQATLLEW